MLSIFSTRSYMFHFQCVCFHFFSTEKNSSVLLIFFFLSNSSTPLALLQPRKLMGFVNETRVVSDEIDAKWNMIHAYEFQSINSCRWQWQNKLNTNLLRTSENVYASSSKIYINILMAALTRNAPTHQHTHVDRRMATTFCLAAVRFRAGVINLYIM